MNFKIILAAVCIQLVPLAAANMDWTSYHRLETISDFMHQIEANYSALATLHDIGSSWENRSIFVLRLSTGDNATHPKPAVFIEAGVHSNEWISHAVATYFIQELCTSPQYENLLSSTDFYILPVLNPDGYEYSHTTERMFMKNKRPDPSCDENMAGVNLNVNFDFMHNSSAWDKCHIAYGGEYGFSEPETRALRDFIMKAKWDDGVNWMAYFSLHSYGQYWLLPWGYKEENPSDFEELKLLAEVGINSLKARHGTEYEIMTPFELGGGGGLSQDWAKGVGLFKYTQTLELRDKGEWKQELPPDQIIPCAEETLAAVEAYVKAMLQKNFL